ncbi:MAG: xanthine dehydrogenase family protein subunit M [Chloroflexi bacterium]|nr:xanthine dehydrogenase family protein subunit M [Chloroflexota bacterium]MDA1219635.1 xanthine dehydrogenase family protein subunit M [Chloroflexota bacterium]
MFSAEFDYHKASSVAEAIQLLGANPDAKLMAGGHSLIPLMKLRLARPSAVIDIGGVAALKGISINNGNVRIGALTTHGEIASSPDLRRANPLMAEAAGGIGDTQVRNRGTIGGNIAHADPASDWGTVLTALDATIEVEGPNGKRTMTVENFFKGAFTTALAENEVITAIYAPVLSRDDHDGGHGHGHDHGHEHGHDHGEDQGIANVRGDLGEYAKMAHPASFYPVVGGAVVVTVDGGRCLAARVAAGGLVPSPVRARSVEQALIGKELTTQNISDAVDHLADDLGSDIIGDVYASADFRLKVAPVEIKHALYHAIGLGHH